MAEVVFDAGTQQEAEVMLTRNHGFGSDGTPNVGFYTPDNKGVNGKLVKLYDAQGNQIEEMPDRVFLRFNGKPTPFLIQSRDGGVLETFNGENIHSYVLDSAVLGLLGRGHNIFIDFNRQVVYLYEDPSIRLRVAIEATEGGAPVEATIPVSSTADPQLIQGLNKLMTTGTPAQRDAAVRLLGTLKQ